MPELELAVSATTRSPRPGETQGVHYHFLDEAEFLRRVEAGDFVEHAEYSGRRYGTLRSELEKRIAEGHSVVLEIEVQGARQIAQTMPDAVRIFIAPPDESTLLLRLIGRGHGRRASRSTVACRWPSPSSPRSTSSRTSSSTIASTTRSKSFSGSSAGCSRPCRRRSRRRRWR